jgi:hypothetical protein|tara:strand:+ start:177 stop:449 length:273 start_codon:yes stop_codon:yes gene_type:complete
MTLSQKRKLELSNQLAFKRYVFSFYGDHEDGLYLQKLKLTQDQINKYCDIYLTTFQFCYPMDSLCYDSVDRERVREIIEEDHNLEHRWWE